MQQAFRYRFYPTPEQASLLRRTLGCVRLVYNRALAARTEGWYERQEKIDYIKTSALLTQWKKLEELQFRLGGELRTVAARTETLAESVQQLLG
jgi:putative transposase